MELLLIMNLSISRISWRKPAVYSSFATENPLLRLCIWICRLRGNLILISNLILIVYTVDSSLTVLAHRNELLIRIPVVTTILSAHQLSHLIKLIEHVFIRWQNIIVSYVLVTLFLIITSLVASWNTLLIQDLLEFLVYFILPFIPIHE